jgi:hypothetical protein
VTSRVVELWNRLASDQKEAAFWALQRVLGDDPGGELIIAIAADAEAHKARTDPFPYVPPPETVPAEPLICADCGHPITGEVRHRIVTVNGSQRPVWVHRVPCYQRGPAVPGDQTQVRPTSMPPQEEL